MKTGEVCCGSLMDKVMGAIRSVGSRCKGKGARAIEEKESRGEGGCIILINPWPPMKIEEDSLTLGEDFLSFKERDNIVLSLQKENNYMDVCWPLT